MDSEIYTNACQYLSSLSVELLTTLSKYKNSPQSELDICHNCIFGPYDVDYRDEISDIVICKCKGQVWDNYPLEGRCIHCVLRLCSNCIKIDNNNQCYFAKLSLKNMPSIDNSDLTTNEKNLLKDKLAKLGALRF